MGISRPSVTSFLEKLGEKRLFQGDTNDERRRRFQRRDEIDMRNSFVRERVLPDDFGKFDVAVIAAVAATPPEL